MILRRLTIRRMPGLDDGFTIDGAGAGVHLVLGPNGSGKTTFCRAVRAVLWPETVATDRVDVSTEWTVGSTDWSAERDGRGVVWRRDGAEATGPPLPEGGLARCFTLALTDLLLEDTETDTQLVERIRRQMAGGYDPRRVRAEAFPERKLSALREPSRLREAQRDVARLGREQVDLAEEEDGLRDLEERHDRALRVQASLRDLHLALDLARERARLADVEGQIATLPSGLEPFREDERDRLDELGRRRAEIVEAIAGAERERTEALAAAERCGLREGPIDETTLRIGSERGKRLRAVEAERVRAERAAGAAAERAEASRAALAGLAVTEPSRDWPPLDAEALDRADAFLERSQELRRERALVEAERRDLESRRAIRPAGPTRGAIERGLEILGAWLEAAELAGAASRGATRLLDGLGGALLAIGATLALTLHPTGWSLAGVGVGILAARAWSRLRRARRDPAAELRRRWAELELVPPDAWTPESVRERKAGLERERDELVRAERDRTLLEALESRDEILRRAEEELAAERRRIVEALGVDPGRSDSSLVALAREVGEWRAADGRAAEARAEERGLVRERDAELERLRELLAAHGLAVADPAEAEARLEDLAERSRARAGAETDRLRAERALAELRRRLGSVDEMIAAFWSRLGRSAPDEAWLESMLPAATRWRALRETAARHRANVAGAEGRLSSRADLLDERESILEERIARAEGAAAEVGELKEEMGRLREKVEAARGARAVEEAIARRDEAGAALEARRDEALRGAAGRFLLDRARAEHDRERSPRVVRDARDLFRRFTRNEFGFEVDDAVDPPALRARENASGRSLRLSELSDGTRVQLLLAVRLAFARAVEETASGPLPLLLDEVLTTSDPGRFRAIAASLAALVRDEGRQIFYLSSNPADAASWRGFLEEEGLAPPVRYDLAERRASARGGIASEESLDLPALPSPPAPAGDSAAAYGARIGVEPFDPRRPAGEMHLFHLLRDDLPLLHLLLRHHVRTLGQWRALEEGEAAEAMIGETATARVTARADLAVAFHRARAVGRGRPVDGVAIREAGLGDTIGPRVAELVRENGGDARELLRAIEAGRVKRFQKRKQVELKSFLLERGHLDERERLDEDAVRARVLAECALHLSSGALAPEEVARLVGELWSAAERTEAGVRPARRSIPDPEKRSP